jgi:O-antigen/teichoic acid export membrane protein
MFGKVFSVVVGILTLIVLVRWLDPEDFSGYVIFLALQSILLALSSLGIDTTAERFLPELRTRHLDPEMLGFVATLMGTRLISLMILTVIAWYASTSITDLIGLERYLDVFKVWTIVIMFTGMLTFSVVLLDAMLHQRDAQRCMVIYVLIKLIMIWLAYQFSNFNLDLLVHIELIATVMTALIGTWLLIRQFSARGLYSGWYILLESRRRMMNFASFNYLAQITFQLFSPDMMKLLVMKLLGAMEAACYGFAYSLADTVQRYLPAMLLVRLIKPIFVSRYTKTRDFSELNEMARIILKINLLVLSPVIAFTAVYGESLLSFISNGKYSDAHLLLVGILSLLLFSSHQLVLSILAGTLERNVMQLYAGIASVIAFPCAFFFLPVLGSWGAVIASIVGAIVYNTFATVYLRRAGFNYRPDLRGVGVFLASGILLFAVVFGLDSLLSGWTGFFSAMIIGLLIYIAIVRAMSAFSSEERMLINAILPKPVFIF